MLSQYRVSPHDIAVAGCIPHDLAPVVHRLRFQQRFPDPDMRVRSVMQVKGPVKLLQHGLHIPHTVQRFRFKQEQVSAASLAHVQGMLHVRRKNQHFALAYMINCILYDIIHHTFKRQADFDR